MKKLYEMIRSLNPNCDNRVLTVIDGPDIGEKLYLSNGNAEFVSRPGGFFDQHPETRSFGPGITEAGGVRVYCEKIASGKNIVICGAGHVGIAIARLGKMIGCGITVIDDRPMFADQARALGVNVICDSFMDALGTISGDPNTFFVIVTRGHRWDRECLREIVRKPHAYIGMMGSRRRVHIVLSDLEAEGADPEVIAHVHTPIGLKIGAETPEEIAVSVIAEIIQVKNAAALQTGYSRDILDAILGDKHEETDTSEKILLTIVARKGSAPREAGAKMVLLPDGVHQAGTIGGGCVEAEALTKARGMLQDPDPSAQLLHVNMTADEAEEEGMVCGGVVDILLEKV